jgi:hypothetical protein
MRQRRRLMQGEKPVGAKLYEIDDLKTKKVEGVSCHRGGQEF